MAKFTPKTGKVVISLIQRKNHSVIKDPDEMDALTGTYWSIVPPSENGRMVRFITPEEQEWLEKELGFEPGYLNPGKPSDSNIFEQADKKNGIRLKLHKPHRNPDSMSLILDKSKPMDYLLFKIAQSSPIVANSWEERNKRAEYLFVIKDEDAEFQDDLQFNEKDDVISEYLLANKTNKKKLYDLLRIAGIQRAGKPVTMEHNTQWLYNELKKLQRRDNAAVHNLYDIISLDPDELEGKVLLADGISLGDIKHIGDVYKLREGRNIGYSEAEAINTLMEPEFQDLKLLIKSKVEKKMK